MDLVQAKMPDNIDGTPRYANPCWKRVICTSICRMAPICLHCSHSGDDELFAYDRHSAWTRIRPESDSNRLRGGLCARWAASNSLAEQTFLINFLGCGFFCCSRNDTHTAIYFKVFIAIHRLIQTTQFKVICASQSYFRFGIQIQKM